MDHQAAQAAERQKDDDKPTISGSVKNTPLFVEEVST
jgi:hypothetical protein